MTRTARREALLERARHKKVHKKAGNEKARRAKVRKAAAKRLSKMVQKVLKRFKSGRK